MAHNHNTAHDFTVAIQLGNTAAHLRSNANIRHFFQQHSTLLL